MSVLVVMYVILIIIAIAWLINEAYLRISAKRAAKFLAEEDFREGMRKAQVVDVREKDIFDAGHILGARSMPYSTIKTSLTSLRKDQPIYIYDQKKSMSIRTAVRLKKNGYTDLYILKGGFDGWSGKIKKKQTI